MKQVWHWLEQNHELTVSFEQLAEKFGYSAFHFHRQFKAKFGVTVKQVQQLFRLHRAFKQLLFRPQLSILEVALTAGFESHEGFIKAIKKQCGLAPSKLSVEQLQQLIVNIEQQIAEAKQSIDNNKGAAMSQQFEVEITDIQPLSLVQYLHQGTPQSLMQSISEFIQWRKANQLPPSKFRTFNLLYDDPAQVAPEQFRFGLACEYHQAVALEQPKLSVIEIPESRWAVITVRGGEEDIEQAIHYLYYTWLEASNQPLNPALPLMLERIIFYPDVPMHQALTKVMLPIG